MCCVVIFCVCCDCENPKKSKTKMIHCFTFDDFVQSTTRLERRINNIIRDTPPGLVH
jgi:hypothetical protein